MEAPSRTGCIVTTEGQVAGLIDYVTASANHLQGVFIAGEPGGDLLQEAGSVLDRSFEQYAGLTPGERDAFAEATEGKALASFEDEKLEVYIALWEPKGWGILQGRLSISLECDESPCFLDWAVGRRI